MDELINIGFTENESKIYVLLSKKGKLSAPNIAKKLSMDRRIVYDTLFKLEDKNKVNKIKIQGKTLYSAVDIEIIKQDLLEKYASFEKIIPQLKQNTNEETQINILHGLNAIKILVRKALEEKKEIFLLGRGGYLAKQLKSSKHQHIPRLAQLDWRMIQTQDYKNEFFKPKELRFLPKGIKFQTAFLTFADKLYLFTKSEEIMLIEITDQNFADTFKEYFKLFWNISKKKK